jgi:hypothetical protein
MRWIGLLAVGAVALHELRYVVGPGAHAHDGVSHVHSHLPLLIALAGMVFLAALLDFIAALLSAERERVAAPSRLSRAWPAATFALAGIFAVQESIEGALFGGHSAGLHGLFGHGGWSVALFAPLLGAVIAFLLRGSEKAIELVARKRAQQHRRKPARAVPMRPPLVAAPRASLLARHLAGRAPPLVAG